MNIKTLSKIDAIGLIGKLLFFDDSINAADPKTREITASIKGIQIRKECTCNSCSPNLEINA